jgi:predicted AAA+ superfamily ATPase
MSADRLASDPVFLGPLLENFVAMELRKQAAWSLTRPRLFHFRTQGGQEVDIVLEDAAGRVAGVEVKASATVGTRDFMGLHALAEASGDHFRRGIVLYTGETTVPFGNDMYALPIHSMWTGETRKCPRDEAIDRSIAVRLQ